MAALIWTLLSTLLLLAASDDVPPEARDKDGVLHFKWDRTTIEVPNHARDKHEANANVHHTFSFSLGGYGVMNKPPTKVETIHVDTHKWEFTLSEESKMAITSTVLDAATGVQHVSVHWEEHAAQTESREICFHMGEEGKEYWFHTLQQKEQEWPMSTKKVQNEYPINAIQNQTDADFQYILEPLFIGSRGFAIILDHNTPLWYRVDPNHGKPQVCIKSQRRGPYRKGASENLNAAISFHVFAGLNIKQVYDVVVNKHQENGIAKPENMANERIFNNPIWTIIPGKSEYFKTKADITPGRVVEYVKDIKNAHQYQHGVISFGSWWHTDSPYLGFDPEIFRDPKKLVKDLVALDYLLELTVSPYVPLNSEDYVAHKDWYVKDNSTPSQETWTVKKTGIPESGHALLDLSKSQALGLFKNKLALLKSTFNISSFVFDPLIRYDDNMKFSSIYYEVASSRVIERYVKVAKDFGGLAMVREGHKTQNLPLFVRMAPRKSDESGLKSLIPTALALSLGGYSYFIPDVVGGSEGAKPTQDLYTRWAQAVSLMPVMAFARPPWDINEKTHYITKKCVDLHSRLATTFTDAARKRAEVGAPIIRPLWYVNPDDMDSFPVADQFMLGDDIMVAPIVTLNTEEREVYFPKDSSWIRIGEDGKPTGAAINGPQTIPDVKPSASGEVIYFKRTA